MNLNMMWLQLKVIKKALVKLWGTQSSTLALNADFFEKINNET